MTNTMHKTYGYGNQKYNGPAYAKTFHGKVRGLSQNKSICIQYMGGAFFDDIFMISTTNNDDDFISYLIKSNPTI